MKKSGFGPRKTPMSRGTSTLKRSGFSAKPAAPLARSSIKASSKPMKSKQRPVSAAEKIYWSQLAEVVGCIACHIDGHRNTYVSLHHIDGRTKEGCHRLVLPLCAQHHQQDDTDPMKRISVHGNKARFEAKYGTQLELKAYCDSLVNFTFKDKN